MMQCVKVRAYTDRLQKKGRKEANYEEESNTNSFGQHGSG